MNSPQWYVRVENHTVGPLSTDLVLRGLADGELPSNALVCRAGAYSWLPLSSVPPFSGSASPPAPSGPPAGSGRPARAQGSEAYEALTKPGGLQTAAAFGAESRPGSSRVDAPREKATRTAPGQEAKPEDTAAVEGVQPRQKVLPPPKPPVAPSPGVRAADLAPVPGGLLDSEDFAAADFSDDELIEEELFGDSLLESEVGAEHRLLEADSEPVEALQPLLEPDEPMVLGADSGVDTEAEPPAAGDVTAWRDQVGIAPDGPDVGSDRVDEGGSEPGNGPLMPPGASVDGSLGTPITPAVMLSVSCVAMSRDPDVSEAEASKTRPVVADIDESDFADAFDVESNSSDSIDIAPAPVATVRSAIAGAVASSQPGDRDSSILVTPQVVIAERADAPDPFPTGGVVQAQPSVSSTGFETVASAFDELDGNAVPRVSAPAARENPFMSEPPVGLDPSPWEQPDNRVPPGGNGAAQQGTASESSAEDIERSAAAFDWSQQFCGYFQVSESFELPDHRLLTRSLELAALDVLVQPEALWNLAVCLAMGPDALAVAAADAFFRIMMAYPDRDRLDWMARVLLSRGFMPSGIPLPAGQRAVRLLEARCPAELRVPLSEVLAE